MDNHLDVAAIDSALSDGQLFDLPIAPVDLREVVRERVVLPEGVPDRWLHGWHLAGIISDFRGEADTPVPGALVPGSVRLEAAGRSLVEGRDFLVDEHWGALTRVGSWSGEALATYRYTLRRVDAIVAEPGGGFRVIRGVPHVTTPMPPPVSEAQHVANAYVSDAGVEILPRRRSAGTSVTQAQPQRLPSLARVRGEATRPVRITCWGDSVTVGGSSSSDWSSYPHLIELGLRQAGVDADVTVVAVGGTTSTQWLDPTRTDLPFAAVVDSRPDVLIVEFVNDAEGDRIEWERSYESIRAHAAELGADLLLMTPHFVMPAWMHHERLDEPDLRPYVTFLRTYCAEHDVALADAARGWEALYAEGTAYPTLLRNGINHPDDRGHGIYAREALAALGVGAPRAPKPVLIRDGWMAQ